MSGSAAAAGGGGARVLVAGAVLFLAGAVWTERESAVELALRLAAFADAEGRLQGEVAAAQASARAGLAEREGSAAAATATAVAIADAAWIRAARHALEAGRLETAAALLERTDPARRRFEWHHLDLARRLAVAELAVAPAPIVRVALSRDGARAVTADESGNVAVYDVAARSELAARSVEGGKIVALAIAADGARVAVGTDAGAIVLYDGVSLDEVGTLAAGPGAVGALAFAAAAPRLAAACDGGVVRVFDLSTMGVAAELSAGQGAVFAVALDDRASQVFAAGDDGSIAVFAAATGALERTIPGDGDPLGELRCDALGRRLLARDFFGVVRVLDAATGAVMRTTGGGIRSIDAADLDAGGDVSVLGSVAGRIDLEDAQGRLLRTVEWGEAPIEQLAAARAGEVVVFTAGDERTFVVDRSCGPPVERIGQGEHSAGEIAPSPSAAVLLLLDLDGGVAALAAEDGAPLWQSPVDRPSAVAWSQDGARAFAGRFDGAVELLDGATGATVRTIVGETSPVEAVADLAGGALAVVHRNGAFFTADAAGARLRSSPAPPQPVLGLDVDRGVLAWAAAGGNVRTWDLATGERRAAFKVDDVTMISGFAYSGAVERVALAFRGGRIELWDLGTGEKRGEVRMDTTWVQAVAFSSDGERLAAAGFGGEVALIDAANGELLVDWRTELAEASSIAFLPGDRQIAVGGAEGPLVRIESDEAAWRARR